ncbi:hypothetical protein SteCoe_6021 [Stentor coeruleus]|uniref:Uncharacterized protein n=1 Tax=Stentor coeruleus TaxID=5963 RepID=A0A1R2CR17_9CILI|nr:hypothetical protein SteCoe_6021 [Stentor coeruleus]
MGQTCSNTIFSCSDCSFINPDELSSETSNRFDTGTFIHSIKEQRKDPIVHCIERLDNPIVMYEREFQESRNEIHLKQKTECFDETFRITNSPKPKIMSSNASEKSVNLIDRIPKTNDTDKSFSTSSNPN